MISRTWRLNAALCFSFALLAGAAFAAPFTPGNVVVYRIGDGTAGLSNNGNAVFLDEYTSAGTLVQSIPMPTAGSGAQKALVASGTATTDGNLSRSDDGNCLAVPGYGRDLGPTTNLVSAAAPRVVGRVNAVGAIDTSTAFTGAFPANNIRSAASSDCANFWVGGAIAAGATGAFHYVALGATTSTEITASAPSTGRVAAVQGGQLYADTSVTAIRTVGRLGTGLPTTGGQTLTALSGLPNTIGGLTGQPWQFFLARLASASGPPDTLYIADDTSGILKYSLVGTTWVARGISGAGTETYRGLAGTVEGTTVTLFAVRGGGNEIVRIIDTGGAGGTLTATPTSIVTLAAGSNKTFRGLAMTPQVTVTPTAGTIPHGTISPNTPQVAGGGTQVEITFTPEAGYSPNVVATATSCGGGFTGNKYKTNPLSKNCTVDAEFVQIPAFIATPVVNGNGAITPNTPRTVVQGTTTSFTITPAPGYSFTVDGCGGSLAPNSNVYTIAPITADCTVTATFTLITFTVTPSAGANGAITPQAPQTIPLNTTATFDLAPEPGFGMSVGGTCGGTRNGTQYTTNPITADCTVSATFPMLPRYAVTPTARGPGSVAPTAPQTIIQGQTATFTVNPDAGYNAAVRGTCGGSWSGNTYTTNPAAADCTVDIAFARKLVLFVGNSYTFGRVDPVMSYNTANVTDLNVDMNDPGTNADEPHPWGGIPGVFKKLTDQASLEYDVTISARNAASLRGHYLNTNPAGWDLRSNISSQRFDVVMLQDLSDEPLPAGRGSNANLASFNTYVDKIEHWVHDGSAEPPSVPANPNARPEAEVYLYATWARPDMIGPNGTNADGLFYSAAEGLEAMTADLHNAYFSRAVANGHIEDVAPVGDAFLRAVLDGVAMRDPYVPEIGKINLWHTDFFHPSKYGSYLSALVHFQTVSGLNPLTLGPNERAAADLGIAPDIAVKLQRVAQKVVFADTAAPVSTATVSVAPNAAGWNREDVTVTLSAADTGGSLLDSVSYTLSGAQTGTGSFGSGGSFTVTAEGVTTVAYYATDRAGNIEATHTLQVSIDKTAPQSAASATPQANAAGWNQGDVTVALNAADPGGSAVESIAYTLSGAQTGSGTLASNGSVTITAPGTTTLTYLATDRAGNAETPRTLRIVIDRTGPIINGMPGASCNLWPPNHKMVTVATVTAADGASGLASFNVTAASNEAADPSDIAITGTGTAPRTVALRAERLGNGSGRVYTVTATATDIAGNTTTAVATCTVPHNQ
jgi:hypothetical protein